MSKSEEVREIKIGDKVWCADYDDFLREECWINGKTVSDIKEDKLGGRAMVADFDASHRLVTLTTVPGEWYSPEAVLRAFLRKLNVK